MRKPFSMSFFDALGLRLIFLPNVFLTVSCFWACPPLDEAAMSASSFDLPVHRKRVPFSVFFFPFCFSPEIPVDIVSSKLFSPVCVIRESSIILIPFSGAAVVHDAPPGGLDDLPVIARQCFSLVLRIDRDQSMFLLHCVQIFFFPSSTTYRRSTLLCRAECRYTFVRMDARIPSLFTSFLRLVLRRRVVITGSLACRRLRLKTSGDVLAISFFSTFSL